MNWKDPEIDFMVAAVCEAAALAIRVQADLAGVGLTKDDRSPVTIADFGAQALVARRLAATLPRARLVGEESSGALRKGDGAKLLPRIVEQVLKSEPEATEDSVCEWIDIGSAEPSGSFWTLDPIDGTKGFLRNEHYAVALARIDDGRVTLGALACPRLGADGALDGIGAVYAAAQDQGTWVAPLANGEWNRVSVSRDADLKNARLLRSVDAGHTNEGQLDKVCASLGIEAPAVCLDSQAKYGVLASGGAEILLRLLSPSRPDYRELIWDQAAGSIVLEEAGGRITDLDGRALDFSRGLHLAENRGVCATNGLAHDAVLGAIRDLKI